MHIVDTTADLDEEVEGGVFAEELLFSDQIKQISFTSIFQGKVYRCLIFKTGIKPANIFVI
mgnify:CR=1 FL=1